MLEAMCHADNAFVTLTYEDAPESLRPGDLRDWIKRLRKAWEPRRLRYFAVGEYGDKTGRPHYHAALFGFPCCVERVVSRGECKCASCSVVRGTWKFGHVLVGTLTPDSAQYCAGYVLKKMTSPDDVRLHGRVPEFSRMSLKPGIGANALWDVASAMMQYKLDRKDVSQLRHGGKLMPLGRYLKGKLRDYCGQDEETQQSISDQALSRLYEELSQMRGFAAAMDVSVKKLYAEVNAPYEQKLEGKDRLYNRRTL